MSFAPRYRVTQKILELLATVESVRVDFEDKAVSTHLLFSLRNSARFLSVHCSTKIEGNRLTLKQVEETLLQKKSIPLRERDAQEVIAYYNALTYMEESLERRLPITESFVRTLHGLVEGTETDYRDGQNAIYDQGSKNIVYLPPEAADVPKLMEEFLHWIETDTETPRVIFAGLVHYQFVTIHPYYDGNGRTARLLTSYLMRKHGYGLKGIYALEEYYSRSLGAYYTALATHPHHNYYEGRDQADLTPWVEYFVAGVAEAFVSVQEKAQNATKDEDAAVLRKLDVRQRKLLELFTQFEEVTTAQIGAYLGIGLQSARLLARRWETKGFLEIADTSKKNRKYRLAALYAKIVSL